MRGKVEVFAVHSDGSESLVASESNLVVNGAGESIVDMLTTPSSVLGITPRVMDTSNWRFGALSFGPAAGSFSGNAYFFPEEVDGQRVYWKEDDLCTGASANVTSWFDQVCTDHKLRVFWSSATIGAEHGATASSYTPPYRLPSYPDPLNKRLENARTSYAIVSGDGTECFGQFENRIQFAPDDASSYFQGAYPRNDPDQDSKDDYGTSAMLVSSYVGDFQADTSANMIVFRNSYGPYNQNNVIDYRGFITTQYNRTAPLHSLGRVSVSGGVSNDLTGDDSQVTNPMVTVFTSIPARDTWVMNLYGGLHQIGLWNMDTPTASLNNEAPFLEGNYEVADPQFINTTTGVTKQEFKLFAKKTFTNNLTWIMDELTGDLRNGLNNSQQLRIKWTIDFRSGGEDRV
jgi:hypothetical protein